MWPNSPPSLTDLWRLDIAMRRQTTKTPLDWLREAERQHGVISRAQLLVSGLSASAIDRMVGSGRLTLLHRGVYAAAGRRPDWFSNLMAATLAAGEGSVASHRSAAALWRLRECSPGPVEVTTTKRIQRDGVVVHRGTVRPHQMATVSGIPVTSIHRTLIDLGDVADRHLVEDALDAALDRRMTSVAWLMRGIDEVGTRGRRGPAMLKRILEVTEDGRPPSWLERRFIRLLTGSELNGFVREHPVGSYFIDFAWPEIRLGIEVHGAKWHKERWQGDFARHNALTVVRWTMLHLTWDRIRDEPGAVLTEALAKYHELRWDLWRLGPV